MSLGYTKSAAAVFDPVDANGNPRGGNMAEARTWCVETEALAIAIITSGAKAIFSTKTQMDADLAYDAKTIAWVMSDPFAPNLGVYKKSGATGVGSWVRQGDIPVFQGPKGDDGKSPFAAPVAFASGIVATNVAPVTLVVQGGSMYSCVVPHTTTTTFISNNWVAVGGPAIQIGTTAGTVAAGNDPRFAGTSEVFNTYINAAEQGANSISPADADIGPKLQAIYDANPGKTIVIPRFEQKLNWITPLNTDIPHTSLMVCRNVLERPAGNFLKSAMIEVRKRTLGGPKLDNIHIETEGRPLFLFQPVMFEDFAPAAGSTLLPMSAPAGINKFDFVVFRTRAGVTAMLSQSSDLTAASSSDGPVLAAASLVGDLYDVYVVPGDARTGAVCVEGTAGDRVGTVTLGDYDVEGFCYIANCVAHFDEVYAGRIRTYGCIDRGGLYPYQSGGKLVADHLAVYGKMRSFSALNAYNNGNGVAACAYAFNVNPIAGQVIEDIHINSLHTEDMSGHSVGLGGDVRRVRIDAMSSQRPGFYHIVGFGGAEEPTQVTINNAQLNGSTFGESVYWLSAGLNIDCEVSDGNQIRIGGSGTAKVGNKVKAKLVNPIGSTSVFIQQQTDITLDLEVIGGPTGATTGVSFADVLRPTGRIKVSHTSNAGDAILLSNVDDPALIMSCSGKSRGALAYNSSTGGAYTINMRGCSTTGIQFDAGSNNNQVSGNCHGATFPLINNSTGNNTVALAV